MNRLKKICGRLFLWSPGWALALALPAFALVIYVFMFLLTAVMFDRKGNRRFGGKTNTPLDKLMPKEEVLEEPVPEEAEHLPEEIPEEEYLPTEEPEIEYEKQGEQVITADDIVIEGLD